MSTYDPTDIRGQDKRRQDIVDRERVARDTEISDFKWLMGTRQGRRIVWRLLEESGPYRSTYDQVAMKMAFNEGRRAMSVMLMTELMSHCPETYLLMQREQKEKQHGKRDSSGDHSN